MPLLLRWDLFTLCSIVFLILNLNRPSHAGHALYLYKNKFIRTQATLFAKKWGHTKNRTRLDHSPSSKNKVSWISTGSPNINLVCTPHKASVTYFITFPSQTLHSEFSNDRNKGKNKLKKCIKQLKMISSYHQIFPRGFLFFLAAQLFVACLHGTTFLTLTSVYIAILSSTCCWSLISSPTLVHRLDHCSLGRCSFVWNRVGLTCKIPAYLRR